MGKKTFTHEGIEVGCDARVGRNYRKRVLLRETACFWVSESGRKYNKKNYGNTPGTWPMFRIELDTIKAL